MTVVLLTSYCLQSPVKSELSLALPGPNLFIPNFSADMPPAQTAEVRW